MTIILKERSGETLRVSRVPAETIAELRAMLPADLTLIELPDDPDRCPSTCSDMHCELAAGHGPYHKHGSAGWEDDPRVRPAGYFGLAVALARKTWGG